MRTSEECVQELHRRMKARRSMKTRRRYRLIGISSAAACLVLITLVAVGVSRTPVQAPGTASGGAVASILADRASLGFILVGLIAFCLGVLVTILCFRLRKRMEEEDKHDERR